LPDFRKLATDLLVQKPELSEQKLLELIEQKKKKVGGGYLTDQGALFLVASDMGVSLDYSSYQDITLKDMYIGAGSITVKARILAIYPAREYERKDGTRGEFRKILLVDGEGSARLTLWDEKVKLVEELSLKIGDAVRIANAYVRAGLDGSPSLNLGQKGAIEILQDDKIPSLHSKAKKVSDIKSIEQSIILECVVQSTPRKSDFTTKDGRQGTLLQFVGGENGAEMRVVIWNNPLDELLNAGVGSRILLVNVRSKEANGIYEIHGDEGTIVQIITHAPVKQTTPLQNTVIEIEGSVLSVGDTRLTKNGLPSVQALLIGSDYKIYTAILIGDVSNVLSENPSIKKLGLKGRLVDERRLICDDQSSVTVLPSSDKGREAVLTKLSKIGADSAPIFCDVIALSKCNADEITTKEGETVRKAELIVGDETGETRLTAWREEAKMIEGIQPGEKLRLKGFQVQKGRDGSLTLLAKPYSSIERN
jgi:replication factor A1